MLSNEAEEARRQLEEGRRQADMDKIVLRKEIAELHVQLETVLRELQNIVDAKISLGPFINFWPFIEFIWSIVWEFNFISASRSIMF